MATAADTAEAGKPHTDKAQGAAQAEVASSSGEEAVGKDGRKREAEAGAGEEGDDRRIDIKVVFGKQSSTVSRPLSSTVAELKQDIAAHTGVPTENQKLLFKGQLKDEQTLEAAGLKSGSKVIVMGSRPEEIKTAARVQVTALGKGAADGTGDWDDKPASEPWSDQEQHRKVLGKGRPDDGWPGISGRQVPLRDDQTYIPGLLNSQGTKVRLTFKPELQQLWVGSAVYTQKVMYATITKIESQPIKGQEEYSIMRLQVGSAGTSNLWLYFVPSQAVSGIKLRILGVGALL